MPDDAVAQMNNFNFRSLGICWVIYGVLRLVAAVWLVSFSNTATVMFGALLNRVADPFTLMNVFHVLFTLEIALSAVCGVVGVLAGLALLSGQKAGRTLALIAGFLSLSDIPLGTTLGIYSLIILLPLPAGHRSSVRAQERAPELSRRASTT